MKFFPTSTQLNLQQISDKVNQFWQQKDIFNASLELRKDASNFTFYEGPPSANGEPGIHHVFSRTIKDIFCRYKTMRGYFVPRKAGWDAHGLPVELQVEKSLGITKEEIGLKISIKDYNELCKKTVIRYKDQWEKLTEKLGYWLDFKHPYVTSDRKYMLSIWYLIKQFYERGLLYSGHNIQPYSPAAGTALSSHELNQPGCYKSVKDISIVAQFKLKNVPNTYLLAWTTTPWTLPANSALAVGKQMVYVKIRTQNPYTQLTVEVILAESALPRYFSTLTAAHGQKTVPVDYEIVEKLPGEALIGMEYEQLLPYVKPQKRAFFVVNGDFVSTEEGTGIVHIAPSFGADDMRLAKQYNIPAITVQRDGKEVPIVDKQGRFVAEITDWAGKYVKEAYESEAIRQMPTYKPVDVLIAIALKETNKAFQVAKYTHNYPHCWRTDKPILYYPVEAWFIKTTDYKESLLSLNKEIQWKPAATGTGRFENWLFNLVDWNISRDRFWGTPIPIWISEDRKEQICIGSLAELTAEINKAVEAGIMKQPMQEGFDLHRPYIDDVVLLGSSGKPLYRVPEVIDVWFDSGAMPYAQWSYPFENKENFEKHFPADFIAEGVDQTRGWFFTLHAIAGILFNSKAFKNVISNGLILDKHGQKMSKRLNNSIDPFQIIEQYGADALRWYIISNAPPWDNLKFDPEALGEVIRKYFVTLHNTYNFFAIYANLDGFDYQNIPLPIKERPEIDRWIISRLQQLIKLVTQELDFYEPTKAIRAIQHFVVDELSNWYVRLNRKRFWKSEKSFDKEAAYQTLYTCLHTITQLSAPFAPFYSEQLYKDLHALDLEEKELSSVHMSNWPLAQDDAIDQVLENKMQQAQVIVALVHAIRKKHQLRVRLPLAKVMIPVRSAEEKATIKAVAPLILAETNVKEIVYIDDKSDLVVKSVKPDFKVLGKRFRTQLPEITLQLAALSQAAIRSLEENKEILLPLEKEKVILKLTDVIIVSKDIPGWSIAHQDDWVVALDITLTDELRQEGIARDVVNRVQNIRKNLNFDVIDKIQLHINCPETFVQEAILKHKAYIAQETQATKVALADIADEAGEALSIDHYQLFVKVTLDTLN